MTDTPPTLDAPARLLRGFAIEFLTAHDLAAAARIMGPGYRLTIGGHVFDGRDASYLPATGAQLEQFPGLCVTVHDVILGPHAVAMRFTEHGVSKRHAGRAAAWGGVTLFRLQDGRIQEGWAEEDYFARKRQLKAGECDPIGSPQAAPWDSPCLTPDAETERAARAWLSDPKALISAVHLDEISAEGPRFAQLIEPAETRLTQLFTAGERAAFHVESIGVYAGGFEDIDPVHIGRRVVLRMAGLLDFKESQVIHAQIAADRLGLHRQLLDAGRIR